MNWQAICNNPAFNDLPFKLETDRWGHIVMSPATNRHSRYQARIVKLLERHLQAGEAFPECSIQTSQGVKVADVVWASAAFLQQHAGLDPYPAAPKIVVEVISPSNSIAEMEEKQQLYFASGAEEFWLCEDNGDMRFYNADGRLPRSGLVPEFPSTIQLPF
jgi:Uma2 family endonuclease